MTLPAGSIAIENSVKNQILNRTGRRIRGLAVSIRDKAIVLAGTTNSFHIKQLAQQGVRELFPLIPLVNEITVEMPTC